MEIETFSHASRAMSTIRTLEYLFEKYAHLCAQASTPLTIKPEKEMRRMGAEDKQRAKQLFLHGEKPCDIASTLGFSRAAITGYLHRSGLRQRLTQTTHG